MYEMIRNAEIQRPEPEPLTSTVLDHAAAVVELHEFGSRNNAGLWQSFNALDTLKPVAPGCPTPPVTAFSFDTAPWVLGFEFSVYAGVKCSAVGSVPGDMDAELRRVFARNEGRGVERALMNTRFVAKALDGADPFKISWPAPVDVTPAGKTVNLVTAIGLLEGYAAANYAGLPTLHMPRAMVTAAFGAGALVEKNDKFYTKAGSKVAVGGGYDVSEADGTWQMWATGDVYVERSEQVDSRQFGGAQFVGPGNGPMPAPQVTLGATAATGGTFAAGTYFWVVTALNANGETIRSNEVTATLALNGTQVLNWGAVQGATGYKVYRGTAAGAENVLVASLGTVTTYTDTGAAGTAGSPPANSTAQVHPAGINDNDTLSLVERMYRVGVDGFVATVTATVF